MTTPRYQIQGTPNLLGQRRPSALGLATDFAKNKALSAGLEAAFPGGGLAKEGAEAILPAFFNEGGGVPSWLMDRIAATRAARAAGASGAEAVAIANQVAAPTTQENVGLGQYVSTYDQPKKGKKKAKKKDAPLRSPETRGGVDWNIPLHEFDSGAKLSTSGSYTSMSGADNPYNVGFKLAVPFSFNQGGRAPLGGGQSKEGLMQARQLGALSQQEFLEAMKHAGYLNEGGKVPWWQKVMGDPEKNAKIKAQREAARKHVKERAQQNHGSAGDVGSVLGSLLSAGLFNQGGQAKPVYQRIGGMTPGPLGMSDMLEAGKGKDVSKVVYKKKGGDIEDTVEIGYHAPLAAKPSGDK